MLIRILKDHNGFVNTDYALEGVTVTQNVAILMDDSGKKLATVSDPSHPAMLGKLLKEIKRLNK